MINTNVEQSWRMFLPNTAVASHVVAHQHIEFPLLLLSTADTVWFGKWYLLSLPRPALHTNGTSTSGPHTQAGTNAHIQPNTSSFYLHKVMSLIFDIIKKRRDSRQTIMQIIIHCKASFFIGYSALLYTEKAKTCLAHLMIMFYLSLV